MLTRCKNPVLRPQIRVHLDDSPKCELTRQNAVDYCITVLPLPDVINSHFGEFRTRSSATAEKQRVSYPHGGGLGPPARSHSLATSMRLVECETHNKHKSSVPSTKRTLRSIGHSRSFKIILLGECRNPKRCVVVMCN